MANEPAKPPHGASAGKAAVTRAPLAGTRAQVIQRLQVGLGGLAAILLLVGLAGLIDANREQNEAEVVMPRAEAPVAAPEGAAAPLSDPLADPTVGPETRPTPAELPTVLDAPAPLAQ